MAKAPFRMMISYWTTVIADDVNENVEDVLIDNLGSIFREIEERCSKGDFSDFSISNPYKMLYSKSDLKEWGDRTPINGDGDKTCREYLEDVRREELLSSLSDEDKRILGIS